MNTIFYFPDQIPISSKYHTYFLENGYQLKAYEPTNYEEADLIFLFTPVKCDHAIYVAPEKVWLRFFTERHPAVKIFQVGISSTFDRPNYLNWLRLPERFQDLVEKSNTLKNWDPFSIHGVSLEEIWQRFWDGHHKGGFNYYFINAINPIRITYQNLESGDSAYERELDYLEKKGILKKLNLALSRWQKYEPYWRATPFKNRMEEIAMLLNVTDKFVLHHNDPLKKLLNNIGPIKEQLEKAQQALEDISTYFN